MKVKVCGMKYHDNIKEAASLLPDFMGFIFYPQSKRYVGEDFVLPAIPDSISKTGVFVNDLPTRVFEKVNKYNLDIVQLHGNESVDYCKEIRKKIKIIKAFGIDEQFDFSILDNYENSCDYFLFDTKTTLFGGSGMQFDKNIIRNYSLSIPFFLSGGIDLNSVLTSRGFHPMLYGFDVNSKLEDKPAVKNINKLKQLIDEVSGK